MYIIYVYMYNVNWEIVIWWLFNVTLKGYFMANIHETSDQESGMNMDYSPVI
jgi:hypothetical protein